MGNQAVRLSLLPQTLQVNLSSLTLRDYMVAKSGRVLERPNRRFWPHGQELPNLYSTGASQLDFELRTAAIGPAGP